MYIPGASPAGGGGGGRGGGQGGNAPPIFVLAPPFISCPPRNFVGRKKLLGLAEKNVWISDFGQKKPSDFGKDLFFWRSPAFGRKKRLNLRFWPEKAFRFRRRPFFFYHLIFTETSPHSNSGIMKKLCPPDFNFATPISRSWRRPLVHTTDQQWYIEIKTPGHLRRLKS